MQVVLTVPNFVRQPQNFANLTAGLVCLHLPAHAGSVTFEPKSTGCKLSPPDSLKLQKKKNGLEYRVSIYLLAILGECYARKW